MLASSSSVEFPPTHILGKNDLLERSHEVKSFESGRFYRMQNVFGLPPASFIVQGGSSLLALIQANNIALLDADNGYRTLTVLELPGKVHYFAFSSHGLANDAKYAICQDVGGSVHLVDLASFSVLASQFIGKKVLKACWKTDAVLLLLESSEIVIVSFASVNQPFIFDIPQQQGSVALDICVSSQLLYVLFKSSFQVWSIITAQSPVLLDEVNCIPGVGWSCIRNLFVLQSSSMSDYIVIVNESNGIIVFQSKNLIPIISKRFEADLLDVSVCGCDSLLLTLKSGISRKVHVPSFRTIYEWRLGKDESQSHVRNDAKDAGGSARVYVISECDSSMSLLQCVTESQPIHRYLQLVQGNYFEEAQSLAESFDELDKEFALKAKLESLADKIYQFDSIQKLQDGLLFDLQKVTDLEWLAEFCRECKPDTWEKARAIFDSLRHNVPFAAKLSISLDLMQMSGKEFDLAKLKSSLVKDLIKDCLIKSTDEYALSSVWTKIEQYHRISGDPIDYVWILSAIPLPENVDAIAGILAKCDGNQFSHELESWIMEKARDLELEENQPHLALKVLQFFEKEVENRTPSLSRLFSPSLPFIQLRRDLCDLIELQGKNTREIGLDILWNSFKSGESFLFFVTEKFPCFVREHDISEGVPELITEFMCKVISQDPLKNTLDEPEWIPIVTSLLNAENVDRSCKIDILTFVLKTCIVPIPNSILPILDMCSTEWDSHARGLKDMEKILGLKDRLAKEFGFDNLDLTNPLVVKNLVHRIINTVPRMPTAAVFSTCNELAALFPDQVSLKDIYSYFFKTICRRNLFDVFGELLPGGSDESKSMVWFSSIKETLIWLLLNLQSLYDLVSSESDAVVTENSRAIVQEKKWLFESLSFLCSSPIKSGVFSRIASQSKFQRVFGFRSWTEFAATIFRVCDLALEYGVIVTLPLLQNESFREYCINDLMKRGCDVVKLGNLLQVPRFQLLVILADELVDEPEPNVEKLIDYCKQCIEELRLLDKQNAVASQIVQIVFKFVVKSLRRRVLSLKHLSILKAICGQCLDYMPDIRMSLDHLDILGFLESALEASDIGKYHSVLGHDFNSTLNSFHSYYVDKGLILDSQELMSNLSSFLTIILNNPVSSGKEKQKFQLDPFALTTYLMSNSQYLLAVNSFNLLCKSPKVRKHVLSVETIDRFCTNLIEALVPKMSLVKSGPIDVPLIVFSLNILPVEAACKLFKGIFSSVSMQDSAKMLQLSRLGIAAAKSWKMTTVASDYERLVNNYKWWYGLGVLGIAFEKEKFNENPPNVPHLKDIIGKLVREGPIETALDFANDFNIPDDHVYFEFMRHVFLYLDDDKNVEKYFESLDLIKAIVPVVANKEKLVSVITELILPYVPAYQYSKISQCLECLGIIDPKNKVYLKGTMVLELIKDYKRVNGATQTEIKLVLEYANKKNDATIQSLIDAGQHRLPFQLLAREPWKVLAKELQVETLTRLMPLASVLELDPDKLAVVCVENYLSGNSSGLDQAVLKKLLHQIRNQETFLRTCKYVSDKFSDFSLERKAVLECALICLENNYDKQMDEESRAEMDLNISRLKEKIAQTEILGLLHNQGHYEQFRHLVKDPLELVIQLLEQNCTLYFDQIRRYGVGRVASRVAPFYVGICKKFGLGFPKIKIYLLSQWLKSPIQQAHPSLPSEQVFEDTAKALQKISVLVLVSSVLGAKGETGMFSDAISTMLQYAYSSQGNQLGTLERLRATSVVLCTLPKLFASSSANDYGKIIESLQPLDALSLYHEQLKYVIDFESLRFDCSLKQLISANKKALVKTLLLEHVSLTDNQHWGFLKLAMRIAIESGVSDEDLWAATCTLLQSRLDSHGWALAISSRLSDVKVQLRLWKAIFEGSIQCGRLNPILCQCPFDPSELGYFWCLDSNDERRILKNLSLLLMGSPLDPKTRMEDLIDGATIFAKDLQDESILWDRLFLQVEKFRLYDVLEKDQYKAAILKPFIRFLKGKHGRLEAIKIYYIEAGKEDLLQKLRHL